MIITFLLAAAINIATVSNPPRYDIVPTPKSLTPAEGEFVLGKKTRIAVEDAAFSEIAEDFTAQVCTATGFTLKGNGPAITLKKVSGLGKEAYRLNVRPDGSLPSRCCS